MNASAIAIQAAVTSRDSAGKSCASSGDLKRVVLFNVKYSPNLGDGLLNECLERELARSLPGCEVVSVDLAGRSAYPSSHGRGRGMALALLDRCPAPVRRIAASTMLDVLLAVHLRRRYRTGLSGAQAVVLGGGNLLTDADLNFPMKISAALAEAARASLPVAIYAVGVSPRWSDTAARLFADAFARSRLVWASVRDERSLEEWGAHFAGKSLPLAELVVDPGVLASLHYPAKARAIAGRRIGFCVTDPLAVRYHSNAAAAERLETWYPAALRSLVEQGFEVVLFTNGSPEDRDYLHGRFADWIRCAKGPVTLGRSFETPGDLAAFVARCDAVVGHRMHACIAAYSFGVPAVGLHWDVKLESFFELAGRGAHLLDPATIDAAELGARTAAAIADPLDPAPLIARSRTEVARFAARLLQGARE